MIIELLINKLLWIAFAFSVLGIGRMAYMFVRAISKTPPEQLVMTKREVMMIGIYLAIIIMSIFTGIRI